MKSVSNVFFRWNQPINLRPADVGEVAQFSSGNQKQFRKSINWMVVGDRSVDASPQFIGVKNVRRNRAPTNPEWVWEADVIGVINGDWKMVDELYTTWSGNGAQTPPADKGEIISTQLSKTLIEQRMSA